MADEEENSSLVVVVIDTNPSAQTFEKKENVMTRCLDSVIAFCNSHLMMNPSNKLAVIGCHTYQSYFLYPQATSDSEDTWSNDGQHEMFSEVKNAIKTNITKLILNSPQDTIYTESLMAGAMTMALCYIHRMRKKQITGVNSLSAKILVVSASGESASQYMNFMNVFFTAQKESVYIDACVIEKDSGLLQQGCDITGGMYLKVQNIASLFKYMLWIFLPSPETRKMMILPPRVHVDYRAACFCHRNLIEIGYVCSVCLSIFCTFSPICSTCQTTFKLGKLPTLIAKKKKKHLPIT